MKLATVTILLICCFLLFKPQPVSNITIKYSYPVKVIVIKEQINKEDKMSIDKKQLRELIVSVLKKVDLYSESAVELLMMTAATESHLGTYIKQVGGPASGVFQMEPRTEEDIWDNYLKYKEDLANKVLTFTTTSQDKDLIGNIPYQIIMARIHYRRVPDKLPKADNIPELANYWKVHYNTYLGKGTVAKAIESYNHYVGGANG